MEWNLYGWRSAFKRSKPFLIGFVYQNLAACIEWQEQYNSIMDDVTMMIRAVILLGNVNIDMLKPKLRWI